MFFDYCILEFGHYFKYYYFLLYCLHLLVKLEEVMNRKTRIFQKTIFTFFFLSGFSGLVYQVLWGKYLSNIFGSSAYAHTIVLSGGAQCGHVDACAETGAEYDCAVCHRWGSGARPDGENIRWTQAV